LEIVFHAHHAVISERLQSRAEAALVKVSDRFPGAQSAVVRFHQDGAPAIGARRVEIVFHASRSRRFVAAGHARTYGPALTAALKRLETQLSQKKRSAKDRAHRAARA
jgi:ribosome-associated translation inhibitor RaiA